MHDVQKLRGNRLGNGLTRVIFTTVFNRIDEKAKNFISPSGDLTYLCKHIKTDDWHLPGQTEHTGKIVRFNLHGVDQIISW